MVALRTWIHKPVAHRAEAPVVAFEGVTVRYGDGRPALEDVSFRLERGERVAIVGPNGAGKSTLLKVIAGILNPSAGTVDVYGAVAGGHICIGYVPQRSQIDWNFPVTVADVVLMGRVARIGLFRQAGRNDRRLVAESLAQVGMSDLAGRQIGELSGGQQQRVFVARALAQEAELLLMDEPLTGLDVPSHEAIFGILDVLRARGMTVLVSTHDLQLAADRFDRLMLLRRQVIGFGQAAEVLTPANLRSAYGTHMTVIAAPEGMLALGDTCCEGDEEHSHA
jgi:manganese/iron transport system ATP-binding protein